jgi:hypothetical protein
VRKSRCEVWQRAQPHGAILRTSSAENRAVAHPTPAGGLTRSVRAFSGKKGFPFENATTQEARPHSMSVEIE